MSIDIALDKNIYLRWGNRERTAAYRRYFSLRFRLLADTLYFINHFCTDLVTTNFGDLNDP